MIVFWYIFAWSLILIKGGKEGGGGYPPDPTRGGKLRAQKGEHNK